MRPFRMSLVSLAGCLAGSVWFQAHRMNSPMVFETRKKLCFSLFVVTGNEFVCLIPVIPSRNLRCLTAPHTADQSRMQQFR